MPTWENYDGDANAPWREPCKACAGLGFVQEPQHGMSLICHKCQGTGKVEKQRKMDIIDGSMDPERRMIGFQRQKNETQNATFKGAELKSHPNYTPEHTCNKDGGKCLACAIEGEGKVIEYDPKKGIPLRTFSTGATRDSDEGKNDYEGFLSPLVLEGYGDYMRTHQRQADGSMRASDNWQLGIPKHQYMKSLIRHVFTAWKIWRGGKAKPEKVGGVFVNITLEDALYGVLFNTMGLLHELLKEKAA